MPPLFFKNSIKDLILILSFKLLIISSGIGFTTVKLSQVVR